MDTLSQQLAQEAQRAEESQSLEDMVPVQYHDFRDVFSNIRKCWVGAIRALRGLGGPKAPRGLRAQGDKLSWYNLVSPPLSTSAHLCPPPPTSVVDREMCSAMHYQPKQPKTLLVVNQGGAGYETE